MSFLRTGGEMSQCLRSPTRPRLGQCLWRAATVAWASRVTCHNRDTCLVTWDRGTVRWSTEMGADTTNLVRWQRPPVLRMSRTHCEGEQMRLEETGNIVAAEPCL